MKLPVNLKKLILIAENQAGTAKVFDLFEEKQSILLTSVMQGLTEQSECEAALEKGAAND